MPNTERKTGLTITKDVINNVYDLSGNWREWTLEGKTNQTRTSRGGGTACSAAQRRNDDYTPGADNDDPTQLGYFRTSRFTLYLK